MFCLDMVFSTLCRHFEIPTATSGPGLDLNEVIRGLAVAIRLWGKYFPQVQEVKVYLREFPETEMRESRLFTRFVPNIFF